MLTKQQRIITKQILTKKSVSGQYAAWFVCYLWVSTKLQTTRSCSEFARRSGIEESKKKERENWSEEKFKIHRKRETERIPLILSVQVKARRKSKSDSKFRKSGYICKNSEESKNIFHGQMKPVIMPQSTYSFVAFFLSKISWIIFIFSIVLIKLWKCGNTSATMCEKHFTRTTHMCDRF